MDTDRVKQGFRDAFGRPPEGVVRAPGRVNLIGEHTDYNDGYVLPIAIERATYAAVARREDTRIRFRSAQAEQPAQIDLNQTIEPGQPDWANYPKGVAAGLHAKPVRLVGCDVWFDSDVPLGGGLSSSASLEVATAFALLHAAEQVGAVSPGELVGLCQNAEHEFAGAPCGIMDQSIAILARPGHALLLDCRTGDTEYVPFDDPNVVLLVADTQVQHEISDGEYAARRKQCHEAASELNVVALRDADLATVQSAAADGRLGDPELRRACHVVTEVQRTLDSVDALKAGDYERFGELMVGSHESLRDNYEVSCPELDAIVELACAAEGVFGARMTGGGFGGCAIILTRGDSSRDVSEAVAAGFADRFGRRCPIFATAAAGGADVVA